jgi:DUF971 family protein
MQPKSIGRTEDGIQIEWQDGHVSLYSAMFLRRKCPCAVCKDVPNRVEGMIPELPNPIHIQAAQQMGWYALQFSYSDKHDTGIYSYEMLRQICPCAQCRSAGVNLA